ACPELYTCYGDLPREELGGHIYSSTPYPADQTIWFHNESSHMHCWPMKQWFYCIQAPQQGGETPLVDCRKVYQLLNPAIRQEFMNKKLLYVRNFGVGFDISRSEFFRTTDRSMVEDYCRKADIKFEWKTDDGLRTLQVRPAEAKHPK